ncbi:MAG: LysR family transcriptional regulator [Burkholderiaceae bacterium]
MSSTPLHHRIRLTQLRLLVGIWETASLLGAARKLHISQPAATKALRQMEQEVGEPLVRRSSAGSVLTEAGELLCRRARLILAELQDAEDELRLWHEGRAGHVTIGALPVATPRLVPDALRELAVKAPRLTVRVVEGSSDNMFSELKAGRLDVLVGRFWPGEDPDLLTEVLYESSFRLGVRADHPLARRRGLTLRSLMKLPWILPPTGTHTRAVIEGMFRLEGHGMPPCAVETTSFLVLRRLLLHTDMICPVPVEVLHDDVQQGYARFLPLLPRMSLPPVGLVCHARRPRSSATQLVIEQLKQEGRRASDLYMR